MISKYVCICCHSYLLFGWLAPPVSCFLSSVILLSFSCCGKVKPIRFCEKKLVLGRTSRMFLFGSRQNIKEFSFSSCLFLCFCWGCFLIFLLQRSCDLVPCGTPSENSFSLLWTNFCFIMALFIMALSRGRWRERFTHSEGEMLGHTSSLSNEQVSFHWLPVFKLGQWEYWVYILHFTQGHILSLFMNVSVTLCLSMVASLWS